MTLTIAPPADPSVTFWGATQTVTGSMHQVNANGKTILCATCHGPNLKGLKDVPSIAGRSPSYIVRQLYDMQSGARAGLNSPKMKPVVANLSLYDILDIAAYTSSLEP